MKASDDDVHLPHGVAAQPPISLQALKKPVLRSKLAA